MGSITPPQLLVADFTKEVKPGSTAWSTACDDIRRAMEYHGCFVALYDGISPELNDSVFKAAGDLFDDVPLELKLKNANEKPYHGYVGQIPFVPLHEGLGIDYSTTREAVQKFTNIMWPQGNESFSESSYAFAKAVAKLDEMVVRMLFDSYGVGNHSESHIDSTTYLLRYLKYRSPEINETTMAFPSHTDKSFITILYQNHISGLEIRTRDGDWMNVTFPPKSFVVMAGDACKAWSNGRVLSPNHKVTMNLNCKETRYTIALFSFLREMVKVPEEFVDEENPLKFKPFVHVDLLKFYDSDPGKKSQDILQDFCGV